MTGPITPPIHRARFYLETLVEALHPRQVRELPAATEFSSPPRGESPIPVSLDFVDAEADGLGRLRFTGIEGGPTMIFSLMLFPHDTGRVPVFASEFVCFGKLVRAAVVDLQPLTQTAASNPVLQTGMRDLASASNGLLADGPLPEWCRAHFTPQAVFVTRKGAVDLLDPLRDAFCRYAAFFGRLTGDVYSEQPPADDAALREYKRHHIHNTPGMTYLSRAFGAGWTQRFLQEGMYAPNAASATRGDMTSSPFSE